MASKKQEKQEERWLVVYEYLSYDAQVCDRGNVVVVLQHGEGQQENGDGVPWGAIEEARRILKEEMEKTYRCTVDVNREIMFWNFIKMR